MVRTTIMLPPALKRRVEVQARQERKSLGRFIRDSLERSLAGGAPSDRSQDPLFADDAVIDDKGPRDMAENHDRYLLEQYVEEHGGKPLPRRSRGGGKRA